MGFYGGNKSIEKTQIVFDKIYSSRTAMDAGVATDNVYIRRFVLVSYTNEDDANRDRAKYDQKTYDSTVWMKEFNGTNGYKYTYVATLDSTVPSIKLEKVGANQPLDLQATGSSYTLYMPEPWDFRITGTSDNVNVKTEGNTKVLTFNLPDIDAANTAVNTLNARLEAFDNVAIEGIDVVNQPQSHSNMVLEDLTYTYDTDVHRGKINTVYKKPSDLVVSNGVTLNKMNKRHYKYRVRFTAGNDDWREYLDGAGNVLYYYQERNQGSVIIPGDSNTHSIADYLTSASNLRCDGIIYVEADKDGTLQYANAAANKKIIDKNASYIYAFETKAGALAAYAYKKPEVDLLFAFTGSPDE